MSQGVQREQTHSRRQVTNAFELPLLQQWEGTQGTGQGGLRGSPEKSTPQPPYRSPAFCCQARAFAFPQLSALSINKPKGLAFPSTSTPAATTSDKPTGARIPAGTSPCSPSALRVGVQWLMHFYPLFSPLAIPMPSPVTQGPGEAPACLGCPGAPPGTLPQFPNLPSPGQH